MTVSSSNSFASASLHPDLLRAVADMGFAHPTPIQRDAIPPVLEGRDVLACAMTGSGKTAAFLLPILQRLLTRKPGVTRALVISPTRELAAQTVDHFKDLARHTRLRAVAVYGGVGMEPQERAFRRGADMIVACPGRLLDHFRRPYARLAGLEVLVLDEADRMLDMGFLPDIRRVLRHLPKVEQTLLFSATMPPPIVALSRELLHQPVRLNVERQAAPATGIRQSIFPVRHDLKPALLLELIASGEIGNALVFTRTKHRADRLAKFLDRQGILCDRIHGNRSQAQRTRALSGFKSGETQVLVATDIAARGIDVEALSHVVNFDVPHLPEDYIHRVGRTARAQATGEAFTFVSPQERPDLQAIERAVGQRLPRRQVDGFDGEAPVGESLEIPLAERIAAIRARRAEERARAKVKAEKKAQGQTPRPATHPREVGDREGRRRSSPRRGDRRGIGSRGTDHRGKDSRSADRRSTDSRGADSRGADSRSGGRPEAQRQRGARGPERRGPRGEQRAAGPASAAAPGVGNRRRQDARHEGERAAPARGDERRGGNREPQRAVSARGVDHRRQKGAPEAPEHRTRRSQEGPRREEGSEASRPGRKRPPARLQGGDRPRRRRP